MARYAKEQKQATRRRIIDAAGRRLKRDGIDGSGIATLMADAGLPNGAFYAHFESKDDLVAHTLAEQLREQRESFSTQPQSRADSSRSSARISQLSTATTPKVAASPQHCSTRSGAPGTQSSARIPTGCWRSSKTSPPPCAARYGVGTCEDAERLRVDARDAPAVPSAGRPRSGRYGPGAGRPERSCVIGRRASRLIGRSEEFRKLIVYS